MIFNLLCLWSICIAALADEQVGSLEANQVRAFEPSEPITARVPSVPARRDMRLAFAFDDQRVTVGSDSLPQVIPWLVYGLKVAEDYWLEGQRNLFVTYVRIRGSAGFFTACVGAYLHDGTESGTSTEEASIGYIERGILRDVSTTLVPAKHKRVVQWLMYQVVTRWKSMQSCDRRVFLILTSTHLEWPTYPRPFVLPSADDIKPFNEYCPDGSMTDTPTKEQFGDILTRYRIGLLMVIWNTEASSSAAARDEHWLPLVKELNIEDYAIVAGGGTATADSLRAIDLFLEALYGLADDGFCPCGN